MKSFEIIKTGRQKKIVNSPQMEGANYPEISIEDTEKKNGAMSEKEHSPEFVNAVLGKIQDINQYGTAVTGIRRPSALMSILRQGLLGFSNNQNKNVSSEQQRVQQWKENVRQDDRRAATNTYPMAGIARVYFNIIGRNQINAMEKEPQLASLHWTSFGLEGNPTLIFDVSQLKEDPAGAAERSGHYRADQRRETEKNSKGESIVDSETGFTLSYRVAPRKFKGIVLGPYRHATPEEVESFIQNPEKFFKQHQLFRQPSIKKIKNDYEEKVLNAKNDKDKNMWLSIIGSDLTLRDETRLIQKVKEVVAQQRKAFQDKTELYLPIYDIHGNLLWPVKMKYSKVKELALDKGNGNAASFLEKISNSEQLDRVFFRAFKDDDDLNVLGRRLVSNNRESRDYLVPQTSGKDPLMMKIYSPLLRKNKGNFQNIRAEVEKTMEKHQEMKSFFSQNPNPLDQKTTIQGQEYSLEYMPITIDKIIVKNGVLAAVINNLPVGRTLADADADALHFSKIPVWLSRQKTEETL